MIQEEEVAEVKWFSRNELEKQLKENSPDFLKGLNRCLSLSK